MFTPGTESALVVFDEERTLDEALGRPTESFGECLMGDAEFVGEFLGVGLSWDVEVSPFDARSECIVLLVREIVFARFEVFQPVDSSHVEGDPALTSVVVRGGERASVGEEHAEMPLTVARGGLLEGRSLSVDHVADDLCAVGPHHPIKALAFDLGEEFDLANAGVDFEYLGQSLELPLRGPGERDDVGRSVSDHPVHLDYYLWSALERLVEGEFLQRDGELGYRRYKQRKNKLAGESVGWETTERQVPSNFTGLRVARSARGHGPRLRTRDSGENYE